MKLILRTNTNDSDMVDVLEVRSPTQYRKNIAYTCWAVVQKDMFFNQISSEAFDGDGIEIELIQQRSPE